MTCKKYRWCEYEVSIKKYVFQDLSYKDKHWHEACFLCNKCRVSLVDKQFGSKVDKIYCGNCYDQQFASRCDGCGQIFRAGKYYDHRIVLVSSLHSHFHIKTSFMTSINLIHFPIQSCLYSMRHYYSRPPFMPI